jgi:hypothetical protein
MIMQTVELSPSQQAAIETQRRDTVLQARYQLSLLDRSERRMSVEDCMAALLGDGNAPLPARYLPGF